MKKLKGIVLAVILLLASIMMPFDVYADTISNSNVNINYYLDSVTETASGSYMQTYRVEFVFDQSYLGWISSRMVGTYHLDNNVPITTSQFTKTQAIYVNGAIAETSFTIVTQNSMNGGALQSLSQSIQNSNVTPLADLSTLDDILNVLTDINNNIEIDVLEELQHIVSNTSLSNDYLDIISKLRQYHFPFESFPIVSNQLSINNNIVDYYYDELYYDYPVFQISKNSNLFHRMLVNQGQTYIFRFIISSPNAQFTYDYPYGGSSVNLIKSERIAQADSKYGYLVTCDYRWNCSNNTYVSFRMTSDYTGVFIPIYFGSLNNKNISTDFALRWGLSNQLIDDIHLIADGTSQSSSAASDLESGNDQMADDMNDLATIENGYNQQFNNQLQQIDFSSPLQSNSGILPAANFVITIFNGLINNNPFSVLIIIVCILLIGKKVIGK